MTKWRQRHAEARRTREIRRATESVSPGTLQNEVRAFAQTQFNR
jgi:DNA-binding HxlR family transcriptional regulator